MVFVKEGIAGLTLGTSKMEDGPMIRFPPTVAATSPLKESKLILFLERLFTNSRLGAATTSGYFKTLLILSACPPSLFMLVGELERGLRYGYCPIDEVYPLEVYVSAPPI